MKFKRSSGLQDSGIEIGEADLKTLLKLDLIYSDFRYVQPACATTGDGLYEGLTWLTSNHKS